MVQLFFLSCLEQSTFVMAKGLVVPLKKTTLPRLELMAGVIAAKLANFVVNSMRLDASVHLWKDSQIVLFWLQSTKSLPQFISRRVSEIQQLIPSATWRHCPTADNPADLLTRRLNFEQFSTSSVWWHGPKWLKDPRRWPTWDVQSVSQLHTAAATAEEFVAQPQTPRHNVGLHKIITLDHYSSLDRLLVVMAYIQRFVDNCGSRPIKN